ncbi:MAG: hypothetical protein ABSG98_11285 [Anaerolineales bacterium]|jgi:hypothetical protein
MKQSDVFPSKWLKAEDLAGPLTVRIADVRLDPIKNPEGGEDQEKPVLVLEGNFKPMILNVTNWKALAKGYGEDSDAWIGKRVTLLKTEVDAFGETHVVIRLRIPEAKVIAGSKEAVPEPEVEDIPF